MFYVSLVAITCLVIPPVKQPKFAAETIDDKLDAATGLTIGDVDGDGKPDILLADGSRLVWYRNGDWKRFVITDSLAENGNACIAARDINGDGKVEVAVGGLSVHYLIRPDNPTRHWTPANLLHGYTVRGIQWVNTGNGKYQLIVLPEQTDTLFAFENGRDCIAAWKRRVILQPLPLAHDLEVFDYGDRELFYISGDGGALGYYFKEGHWVYHTDHWLARGRQLGKASIGSVASRNTYILAAMEPSPGRMVTVYAPRLMDSLLVHGKIKRVVLERKLNKGQALEAADLLDLQRDQVLAGWSERNEDGDFGIKLYVPFNQYWEAIDVYWIDRGGIACENLQVADMDGDGRPDIIATGGSTNNLKIYWNRT